MEIWKLPHTSILLLQSHTPPSPIAIFLFVSNPLQSTQPEDDVVALAWNKQVEHILASAHPNSARSIVWDLRKNEPIIQVTDASNRLRCSCIVWHPDVATQLLTCSDEDRFPVIQMWDLRFATAPTMVRRNCFSCVLLGCLSYYILYVQCPCI